MARSVNLFTGAVTTTGNNPATAEYQMPIQFVWVDNAGVSHNINGTAIVAVSFSYKDSGGVVHVISPAIFRDDMIDMIEKQARLHLGVDA